MPVRHARLSDLPHLRRLVYACILEEHTAGSDTLPTGKSVQFALSYFQSYVSGSRFGVCLLWHPEGKPASPQGFVLMGEPWEEAAWDQDLLGRGAWLWNIYVEPEARLVGAATELLDASHAPMVEMGFETLSFNIPAGAKSLGLAEAWRAKPRGVWYTADVRAMRAPKGD